jgi:hypothetical protein
MASPIDVEGPIRAEVFTVALDGDTMILTGPCGPAPWHIELHGEEHPLETARRIVADALPVVLLVHSTSWRWEAGITTLTFLAVVPDDTIGSMEAESVERADLARSAAAEAPTSIEYRQVLEHALRHLAWLASEDEAVKTALSPDWHDKLASYVPEPFQQLHGGKT